MAFTYLSFTAIQELVKAAVDSGLLAQPRALLLQEIPPSFAAQLQLDPAPATQFRLDLARLNSVERLVSGTVPLEVYLRNGEELIRDLPEADVFRKYHNLVYNRATGAATLAVAAQLPAAVVAKEAIIHQDDTVDRQFLDGCLLASRLVAKVIVPRFDSGQQKFVTGGPWIFNGTGWLIGPDLVITNHHVIHSRRDDEPPASSADFERQAQKAEILFDYDIAGGPTQSFTNSTLVTTDPNLDYCVLRLASNPGRGSLPLAKQIVQITPTTNMPVNIIQHPNGKLKRFALRNNLAVDADNDLLRYYTDTDYGSSGSPVLDDEWRVVALHRGAVYQRASFQGRDTAFVNVGSQIARIVQELQARVPNLLP